MGPNCVVCSHDLGSEQEISRAEAADSPYRELLEFAVSLIRDAQERYSGADPNGKRLWNQSLLERVAVKSGQITRVELKPPFGHTDCREPYVAIDRVEAVKRPRQ